MKTSLKCLVAAFFILSINSISTAGGRYITARSGTVLGSAVESGIFAAHNSGFENDATALFTKYNNGDIWFDTKTLSPYTTTANNVIHLHLGFLSGEGAHDPNALRAAFLLHELAHIRQSKKFRQDSYADWKSCKGSHWAEVDAYAKSAKFWNKYAGKAVARMVNILKDLQPKLKDWMKIAKVIWDNWQHHGQKPTPEDKEKVAQHVKAMEEALEELKDILEDLEFARDELNDIWKKLTKTLPGRKFPYVKGKDMDKKPWDEFLSTFNKALRNVNKAISTVSSFIKELEEAIALGKKVQADPWIDLLNYYLSTQALGFELPISLGIFEDLDDWYTNFDIDGWVDEVHFFCMLEWYTSHSRKPFHWFWSFSEHKDDD